MTQTDRQQVIFDAIEDEGGMWVVFSYVESAHRPKIKPIATFFSEEEAFELAEECVAWQKWAWAYYRGVQFVEGNVDNALAEVLEAVPHPKAHKSGTPFGITTYNVLKSL